jgi:protein MpaA
MAADLPPPATSVLARPIGVEVRGIELAPATVLVVGAIHGDEPDTRRVALAILRAGAPPGARLIVVPVLNPDGLARGTRQNARGVDLNRNFPRQWKRSGRRGDRYWPGPRPASEPETRYAMRLTRTMRPDVSVWLHQPYGIVTPSDGVSLKLVRRYARVARLPVERLPPYRGTAVGWQNATLGNHGAFVVELGAKRASARAVRRHVRAVRAVAAMKP